MSKKSRQKARKHRKHHAFSMICQRCGAVEGASAGRLLQNLADSMNAVSDAGLGLRLTHGIIISKQGYVLPLKGGRWTARDVAYDQFTDMDTPTVTDDDLDT